MAKKEEQDPNKKRATDIGSELGVDLANAIGKALTFTLSTYDFSILNKSLVKAVGTIDVTKALKIDNAKVAEFGTKIKAKLQQNVGVVSVKLNTDTSVADQSSLLAETFTKGIADNSFVEIGKQIGQGLVPELNKVLKLTSQLNAGTNTYAKSSNALTNSYGSLAGKAEEFFNVESQRMREIADEREQLEFQHRTGLNDIFLQKAVQLQKEGKMTEAAMQTSIELLKKRQQREQDSIINNQALNQAIELGLTALNNRFIIQQEISALESENLQGLKGEFAVQAVLLASVGQLTNQKKAQLLLAQQEQDSLEHRKNLLLDIKQANEEYQRAVRQAGADKDLKTLVIRLGLTEDETSQMARLYMEQNKRNGLAESLTAEQVKQLQQQDKSLRHKREEVSLIEHQANWQQELNKEVEEYAESWEKVKGKIKALVTDPKFAKTFFVATGIETAIEGLESMEKRFDVLKKSGLAAGQAAEGMVKTISMKSILGLSDTEGVMQGIVEHYGNVNALSSDMVDDLGKMSVHMGITGQEALKLNAALSQMPGETAETAKNAMHHVGHMAELKGIAPGKIMKDMANNTAEMARAGNKGAEAFGKSVINLHKMGVEMSTASKIAEGLLDFESSLTKQMEASALLGREINLDKARELALNNDLEGATREVMRNVGGAAEFTKLNRMQQNALASSLGLTVEEMTKYIDAQQEQEKYYGKASSSWMNILGYGTEYGTKIGEFLKEHGLLLISGVNLLATHVSKQMLITGLQKVGNVLELAKNTILKVGHGIIWSTSLLLSAERREEAVALTKKAAGWAAEKAHYVWLAAKFAALKVASAFGIGGAAEGAAMIKEKMANSMTKKVSSVVEDKTKEFATNKTAEAASNLKNVGNTTPKLPTYAGKSTGGLTGAIEKIDAKKLLAGGAAMVMVAGSVYIFAKAAQEFALVSWEDIGKAVVGLLSLVGALALVGTIMMSGIGAGAILAGAGAMVVMAGGLFVLGKAIQEVGKGFETIAPTLLQLQPLGDDILKLGTGLAITGAGLMAFGTAAMFSTPGILALGTALTLVGPAITNFAVGITALSVGLPTTIAYLAAMTTTIPALMGVAAALLSISSGLSAVAVAGALALPVLGALTALSVLAPDIGGTFNVKTEERSKPEESSNKELEDRLDILIQEMRGLKAEVAKGGTVYLDSRKVGDTLRLFGVNSSGIR